VIAKFGITDKLLQANNQCKCANKDNCDNGKGFPWASWDPEEFVNAELAFNKENKAEVVDMDDLIANAPDDKDVAPF